ncbi:hypothetical protein PF005_g25794 [Phytophthora fragariae]|uniref:Uncharacterized protein n=1 Tax=Phytophthora fragariae TaxID=53985 RepID=A0A6A3PY62_9STRA|nr:hypothetical protein PF003_g30372 [Phytophthora fragariae]KAE8923214.1 hypothetical protein PF009_g26534 [Phytophthora fragariae]KAE8970813.1 hypothetical protein PF011_g26271 [Phytophthora fragariae]KAE9064942.1 hypothetical protein PF007_g29016 [Phytophthora fragariae]KAE9069287.1 hypothetical protein PF010_g26720 [Phytophthora fragariae]
MLEVGPGSEFVQFVYKKYNPTSEHTNELTTT